MLGPMTRRLSLIVTLLVALAAGLITSEAQAANIPSQLAPGTRPHFFQFGFGVAEAFAGNRGRLDPARRYWGGFDSVKFHQELGFHLNGTAKGPALGVIFQEEIGYHDPFNDIRTAYGFGVAPRFQWDIQPVKNLGLYIAPNISVGYRGFTCPNCGVAHYVDIQSGINLRLMVVNRAIVWINLPQFEFLVGPDANFVARVNFLTGVGVAFP